jgi:hypothetical protein
MATKKLDETIKKIDASIAEYPNLVQYGTWPFSGSFVVDNKDTWWELASWYFLRVAFSVRILCSARM